MTKKTVSGYAGGKMYLLGEYAVVMEHHPAIIFGLDKGVRVRISSADAYSIQSSKYKNDIVYLQAKNHRLYSHDRRYRYVLTAVNTVLSLVAEMAPFKIEIESELDNVDHKKYGLGSSSALIVATLKAMAAYFDLSFSLRDLFKLSVIVQFRLSPYSSFGDLAASVYGGCIYYQKGSTHFLKRRTPVAKLLKLGWNDFIIEPLDFKPIDYVIGYSHLHASSTALVKKVFAIKHSFEFARFLSDARQIVDEARDAIKNHNQIELFKSVEAYRDLLVYLADISLVDIEVDYIKKMNDAVYQLKGVSKSSGAGGGDCVIALANNQTMKDQIIQAWDDLGVEIIRNIKLDIEGGRHES